MSQNYQHLLILTSPPATGKTYWIQSLTRQVGEREVLIISPLRALANECRLRWGEQVLVMTPEEWMKKKRFAPTVIFDEFHLFFYWGDTFRPLMWEVFYELAAHSSLCILLTATLNTDIEQSIKYYGSQFDEMMWFNQGNQKLKFPPASYLKAPSKYWLYEKMLLQKKSASTSLVFCAFREEVCQMQIKLEKAGYSVWSCVGGESSQFSKKMQESSSPDFIVATTVLSHGVNLPKISNIYFLYEVKNKDFWIQMVARGGRKGEAYKVFALEKPYELKWFPMVNFLAILGLSLKIKWAHLTRQMDQWFLRA